MSYHKNNSNSILENKLDQSSDITSCKTKNESQIYQLYSQTKGERTNPYYNLRTKATVALCMQFDDSCSAVQSKLKNSVTKDELNKGLEDFDNFNHQINTSQGLCGRCGRSFLNIKVHHLAYPDCVMHNSKCKDCNTFFKKRGIIVHRRSKHPGSFIFPNNFRIEDQNDDIDMVPQMIPQFPTINILCNTGSVAGVLPHQREIGTENNNGDINNTTDNNDNRGNQNNRGDGGGGDGDNGGENEENISDEENDVFHTKGCNARRGCVSCPILENSRNICSTNTNAKIKPLNQDLTTNFADCNSSNLIYLLRCNKCSLQYVGETGRKLKKRLAEHISAIRKGKGSCPFLIKHFSQGNPCYGEGFSVNVLENLEGLGQTERNLVDPKKVDERKTKEKAWMLRLRSVYPYGMNHDFGNNLNKGDTVIGRFFTSLTKTTKRERPVIRPNRRNQVFSIDDFLTQLHDNLNTNLHLIPNQLRVRINSLKKQQLKLLYNKIKGLLINSDYKQWLHIILDIIETKLYKPIASKPKKKVPKFRIHLLFSSKAYDFINLPAIFRNASCIDLLPNDFTIEDNPMVVFSLVEPIRRKVFNYNKFVSSLNVDDIESIPCFCKDFDNIYLDQHHRHIMTGDLSIIPNKELESLIRKGPKYRPPVKIDFDTAFKSIKTELDNLILTYCTAKPNLGPPDFLLWKNEVLRLTTLKINESKNKLQINDKKDPLKIGSSAKLCLDDFHSKFVFCPTDKAANNVAIICKQLYASIILTELDLENTNNLNTYVKVTDRIEEDIVKEHETFQKFFKLDLLPQMQRLPPMHWTPKIHKTPTSSRFIIGSKMSSLKPLGKAITKIFKVIFKMKRGYYRKAGVFSGLKQFWPIDSHDEIVQTLDRLSSKQKATSISTYDFSTLYTKIPHAGLCEVLGNTIQGIFNDTNRKHLAVSNSSAYFVKDYSFRFKFNAAYIIKCVEFLVNNAYFRVGNAIFRQIVGIPMGSDPAPFFANLYLSHFEATWIKSLRCTEYARAKRVFNTFRFIDDLVTVNDQGEFSRSFLEIYPEELTLNKENDEANLNASYLDLDISIVNNQFEYGLYDKRNAYTFDIVRFPFLCSNMPNKMFYSTISAEILRICRASSVYPKFLAQTKPFLIRMKKQGAKINKMRGSFNKLLSRHQTSFQKFNHRKNYILDNLFMGV